MGKLDLLDAIEILAPGFRIPHAVIEEIGVGPPTDPTIRWLRDVCPGHHIVDNPSPPPCLLQWDLGPGETAVPSIGLEDQNATVVLDDLAARKFALTYNIRLVGTLGLLIRANQQGIIKQLASYIPVLAAAGANLSTGIIEEALELAGEK